MVSSATSQRLNRIPLTRTQWIFLMLMVLSICINYIDRGSLSVADKFLQSEFGMDPLQRGKIYSAFFITYAGFQIVAGWLVDRFNVNRILAAGFLIWSTAMLLTGAAAGFASLFTIRLIMGMGESVAYPSYSKILAGNFREHQRGFANAAIDAGCKLGPALGLLLGGLFMASYGWRMFFFITGSISLLWLIPWFVYAPKDQPLALENKGRMPSISEICAKRDAWGTFVGLFCSNYVWFFILTWLPGYFSLELKYSQSQMAVFASMPLWVVAVSTLSFGYISDRWIGSGASATLVRKTCTGAGLMLSTVMLATTTVREPRSSLVLLCAATFAYGIFSSNLWAVTQTLAGPAAAGRWTGIQNYVGNLSGILAPILTGLIVERTGGHFFWAFVVATGMLITGAFCFVVVVRRVEPVTWSEPQSMSYGIAMLGAMTGAVAGFLYSRSVPAVTGGAVVGAAIGTLIERQIWSSNPARVVIRP